MWQTEVKHGTNQELEQSCTARQIHYTCSTDNWINLAKGLKEKGMQLSDRSQRGNKWCRQPTKEGRKPNSNCFSTLYWTQSKTSCAPWQESCKWLAPWLAPLLYCWARSRGKTLPRFILVLLFHHQYPQSPRQVAETANSHVDTKFSTCPARTNSRQTSKLTS